MSQGSITPATVADDEVERAKKGLQAIGLLPTSGDPSKTEVKSGEDLTLEVSKSAKKAAQLFTGTGGAAGLISGFFAATQGASDVVVASLALATGLVIAAGALAIARVADGDVRGRSAVAVASLNARGAVAVALFKGATVPEPKPSGPSGAASSDPRPATHPTELQVLLALATGGATTATNRQRQLTVDGVRWSADGGLEVRLSTAGALVDWVGIDEISGFETTT